MKTHIFTFSSESIDCVRSLVGDSWRCFGGTMMSGRLTEMFYVFVATEQHEFTITSEVDFFDITGEVYETAISELAIKPDAPELATAIREGHTFAQYAGQKVNDVLVIRDTIDEFQADVHTWRIIKDVGLIIILERGLICLTQDILHDEMLVFTLGTSLEEFTIPRIDSVWRNDELGIEYTTNRELISVNTMTP